MNANPLAAVCKATQAAEQAAFEEWLSVAKPSGDAESIHYQWEQSADFRAFCERLENEMEAARQQDVAAGQHPSKTFIPSKPAGLPTSVERVADQPLLCIKVGPLFTYATLDEAVALRAQLDAEIARLSERFL